MLLLNQARGASELNAAARRPQRTDIFRFRSM